MRDRRRRRGRGRGRRRRVRARPRQLVAQVAVALLLRIVAFERGVGVRGGGDRRQRRARIGDGRTGGDERRDPGRNDARSARLHRISDHGRRERRLGFGEPLRGRVGRQILRQGQGGEIEPVLVGALEPGKRGLAMRIEAMLVEPDRREAARGVERADRQTGGAPVAGADRARLDVGGDEGVERGGQSRSHLRVDRRRGGALGRCGRGGGGRGGACFGRSGRGRRRARRLGVRRGGRGFGGGRSAEPGEGDKRQRAGPDRVARHAHRLSPSPSRRRSHESLSGLLKRPEVP